MFHPPWESVTLLGACNVTVIGFFLLIDLMILLFKRPSWEMVKVPDAGQPEIPLFASDSLPGWGILLLTARCDIQLRWNAMEWECGSIFSKLYEFQPLPMIKSRGSFLFPVTKQHNSALLAGA